MPTAIAPIAPRQLMVKQRRSLVMVYRRGWLQLAGLCEVRQRSLHLAHFHQTKPSAIIEDVFSGANRLRHGGKSYISGGQDHAVRAVLDSDVSCGACELPGIRHMVWAKFAVQSAIQRAAASHFLDLHYDRHYFW